MSDEQKELSREELLSAREERRLELQQRFNPEKMKVVRKELFANLRCVLSIRNPQNRKENSPVSYWEFLSFGKGHDFSSSGSRRGLPIIGQRMESSHDCFPRQRILCASFSRAARPLHVKRSIP